MTEMITAFEKNNLEIIQLVKTWEPKLLALSEEIITERKNKQNRSIKMILGHLIDSASNNTHRIIHLQYQQSPIVFPDYANLGNNDRWIAIQQYQQEDWKNLVELWKYSNFHIVHVIRHLNPDKLNQIWLSGIKEEISLETMVLSYLKHLQLHLNEIEELINKEAL